MSKPFPLWPAANDISKAERKMPEVVETDKKYTLFVRGELTLNWDDLDFLRDALTTVPNSRKTYIQFNENGIKEYQLAG